MLKRSELFNEMERIKSEKYGTDTGDIEHKSTSEPEMRRLERNLETELDN